ncbi:acyltransferase family protein [Sphingosinicella sp. BN140058]|uniref:acyltransferase family protein n=1 Tax=Sphingosinicella sp. BN140058 TaxID=1892855 RepID=UPI00101090CD|nr:acyltransferase family protein [Sphingosinicella sp. BN140058]QAY77488.1 acyltransferase [Sphingosinicella sp. BN140058]
MATAYSQLDPVAPEAQAPRPDRTHSPSRGLRIDIQLLRALAIILVLLHHAHVPYVPGGFLGVDIFFVVSGYLMTGIIARELDEGRFSFRNFYARRIRRLLPAAYATLAVTALLAPFLLDHWEYRDFLAQLAGSFTFVVNLVLWKQSDYFNSGAALKPLLHMWSLSLEEQYYLVLPLLLFCFPKRFRLPLTAAATLISIAACAWLLQRVPSATFYFLPTRFWELGIGSVLALLIRKEWVRPAALPIPRLAAAAILILVPLLVDERGHPGLPALVICLATALLLVPGLDLKASRPLAPLVAIGDRSYSLYLVHWPVYAFVNNIFITRVPLWLNILLLVPVLIWMELQYRLAEQPYRAMRLDARRIGLLVLIPLIVVGGSALALRAGGQPDPALHIGNTGIGAGCDFKNAYAPRADCRTADRPTTLLWGDSFAMHLGPGLAVSSPGGVEQATRTSCGPFLGLAPVNGAQQTPDWARRCIAFNDSVLAALARSPQIDTVILSSALAQYVPGQEPGWHALVRRGDALTEQPQSLDQVHAALTRTVAAIRRSGKKVVLIAPPPSAGFDMARCQAREAAGLPVVAPEGRCDFSLDAYSAFRRPINAFLAEVTRRKTLPILSFEETLCGSGTCRISAGGKPIYRDLAHLSIVGSRALGHEMRMGETARAMAR